MNKKVKKVLAEVLSWIKYLSAAVVFVAVINSQVFALTSVSGPSMESTLFEGESLILDKISYDFSQPKRGDIVVFLLYENSASIFNKFGVFFKDIRLKMSGGYRTDRLIKRVIGIPGDEIDIQNGYLFLNGVKQDESYIKTITEVASIQLPITVPEGYIFVMGDNRMESRDSRHFGLLNIKNIEGKILLRTAPLNKFGKP